MRIEDPWSFWFVMALTAAMYMFTALEPAHPATRTPCLTYKPADDTRYWRYRLVRGKRCWYPARPGRASVQQAQRATMPVYLPEEHNPIDAALDREEAERPLYQGQWLPPIPNPLAPERREFNLRFYGR